MRRGNPITTFTGNAFWPLDPRPEDVDILDIAHSLSQQCRWGGHCDPFISVAEHCVRVSRLVPLRHALWGLLHDAAEAYLVDLPTPIKRVIPTYSAAEEEVLMVIAASFGLALPIPQAVHHADGVLQATEHRDLMNGPTAPWMERTQRLSDRIVPWTTHEAKQKFLDRFTELRKAA